VKVKGTPLSIGRESAVNTTQDGRTYPGKKLVPSSLCKIIFLLRKATTYTFNGAARFYFFVYSRCRHLQGKQLFVPRKSSNQNKKTTIFTIL
jgi:hypothetical protein